MSDTPTISLRRSVLPRLSDAPSEDAPADTDFGKSPATEQSLTSQGVGDGLVAVTAMQGGIAFQPTEAQSRVKSRFWSRWAGGSGGLTATTLDPSKVTLAGAQQLTASAALAAWWVKPGFKDWFLSTSVTEERVDFLLHLALSAAEAILTNDDPRGQSARVAMIKTVAEMAGKLGSARASAAPAATAQDRKIQAIERMTPTELKEFLRASGVDVQTVLTLPQGASEGT